jgi:Domain of unknown function (DUF3479)
VNFFEKVTFIPARLIFESELKLQTHFNFASREQVNFLKDRIQHIPVRLVFESALELMSSTAVGDFTMGGGGGGGASGPPAPIKVSHCYTD